MNIIKKLFSRNKNENIKKENSTRNIEGDVKEWLKKLMYPDEYSRVIRVLHPNEPKRILRCILWDSESEAEDIKKANFESLDEEQKEKYKLIRDETERLKQYCDDFEPQFNREEIEKWVVWLVNEEEIYALFYDLYNDYINACNEHIEMYNKLLAPHHVREISADGIRSYDFMKNNSEYEKSENDKLRRIWKHLLRKVEFDSEGIEKAELDTLNEEQKQKYSELEAEIEILKNDREVQGYLGKQSEFQIWMLWFYEDKSVYLLFVEKLNEYIDLYNEHVIDYNGWNSD